MASLGLVLSVAAISGEVAAPLTSDSRSAPGGIGALEGPRGLAHQNVGLKESFEQGQCGPAILVANRSEAAGIDELELRLIDAGELRAHAREGSAVEPRTEAVGNVLSDQRCDPRAPEKIVDKHRLAAQCGRSGPRRRAPQRRCRALSRRRLTLDFLLHLS